MFIVDAGTCIFGNRFRSKVSLLYSRHFAYRQNRGIRGK
jgi:hypothetical protein